MKCFQHSLFSPALQRAMPWAGNSTEWIWPIQPATSWTWPVKTHRMPCKNCRNRFAGLPSRNKRWRRQQLTCRRGRDRKTRCRRSILHKDWKNCLKLQNQSLTTSLQLMKATWKKISFLSQVYHHRNKQQQPVSFELQITFSCSIYFLSKCQTVVVWATRFVAVLNRGNSLCVNSEWISRIPNFHLCLILYCVHVGCLHWTRYLKFSDQVVE